MTTQPALTKGRRLGSYEIIEPVGQGGMGEVYRARDVRLGRDVAIKILPVALHGDPVLRERFIQEARAASTLEHPHIAVVHEIAEADGVPFIAMELVRGEPLAAAIARGALNAARALDLGIEIAEALARAHEKGIVHRDLKPANVILTDEGHAKIIDFGLAKLLDTAGDAAETNAGTLTESGTVLGTVSYMSPEQVRGLRVDHRSDVFSFGILLFEMLCAHLPFRGRTRVDTMHAILHDPAPPLPPATGPATDDVQRILDKCLAKDPTDRYQGTRDLIVDLRAARRRLDSSQMRGAAVASPASAPWRRRVVYAAAAAAAAAVGLAAIVFVSVRRSDSAAASDRTRWVQLTNLDFATQPALSPDGRMLVFIRGSGSALTTDGQIYLKMLPGGESVPLTNDAQPKMAPVFSPDGSRIAYTVSSPDDPWGTWVVPTLRGEAHSWLRNAAALTWIGSDELMFSEMTDRGHMAIVTASASRANPRNVYLPADQLGMAHRSSRSPDGGSVLVVEMDARGAWIPCRLVPFDGRSAGRPIGPAGMPCTGAAWSPDGRWMYLTANRGDGFHIWRQRFPDGTPEQITSGPTEEEGLAIAADGRSAITSVGLRQRSVWIHGAGGDRQLSIEGYAFWPQFSFDGRRLCYRVAHSPVTGQTPTELWAADVASGRTERVMPGLLVTSYDLSPDDRIVAAVREDDGTSRLWLGRIDGGEPPHRIGDLRGDNPRFAGRTDIVYREPSGNTWSLMRVHDDGSRRQKIANTSSNVIGAVSPDGQWIATSAPFRLVSTVDGTEKPVLETLTGRLRWSADGSLMYLSIQVGEASAFAFGRTFVIPLARGEVFPASAPRGFQSEEQLAAAPGVRVLPYGDVGAGPSANVYAFSRTTITRNLYRVPLP
jgi:Tol biopolymer transport system component/predicted Ser/Thr protein kinase